MSKPLAYVDTSALVKRFMTEAKSVEVEAFLMGQSHQYVLSSLSLTELKSVLQRRERESLISDEVVRLAQQQVILELERVGNTSPLPSRFLSTQAS